ncbi:MAG TPA: fatty acid--CoA ligase [Thermoleophilia bacterium]|nr:fatty acid--CoA ligase [Thermoleophilia bacterium]
MSDQIWRTDSAYDYPLTIKNLFATPIANNPEQEITYRGQFRMTYATFHERVRRLAAALIGLGVKQGDTVGVLDWDSHRYLECFYAIPMIGAVLHTVNVRLSPEQLVYTIDHAEDDVLLINTEFLPLIENVKGRIDTVKQIVLLTDDGTPDTPLSFAGDYESLLAAAEPLAEFPELDETTRATTFYSTGTTGLPKGVSFSHRQIVLHVLSSTATICSARACHLSREDVYMPLTPMFHVHAWGIPYIATMLGLKQVYPGKYLPDVLLRLLTTEGVTYSHCVPSILHMLVANPAAAAVDLSGWKVIIGGSALPKSIALAALRRGIDVVVGYGLSETCPVLTIADLTAAQCALPPEEQAPLRTRTGTPIALVDLRIVDEQGAEVAQDDRGTGEIVVRAPWLTQSYHKDHANSEKLWEGGWLHTQDIAAWDDHHSVRITDRAKDIIKVGGEWLSSLELEDILVAHEGVADAAVIGKPDDKWGEIPLGLVVAKPGVDLDESNVYAHVKSFIKAGVLPREAVLTVVQLVDVIDRNGLGKINKVALRQRHLG